MKTQFILGQTHLNKQIINFKFRGDSCFEFVYRWTKGSTGNIFRCYLIGDYMFRVEIGIEENAHEMSIRASAIDLNAILCSDKRFSKIIWFDKANNTYSETELR